MEFKWELIHKEPYSQCTYRAAVFGGWILLNNFYEEDGYDEVILHSESMVFIPDLNHKWQIGE